MLNHTQVLEIFLMDPNSKLTPNQKQVLVSVLEYVKDGICELEIVSNADALPGVLMCYPETSRGFVQPVLAYLEVPLDGDEETIDYILSGRTDVSPMVHYELPSIFQKIDESAERGIVSLYIGDYFLVKTVANKSGNRILARLPSERRKRFREKSKRMDRELRKLTLQQKLDMALAEGDWEACRLIKSEMDKIREKEYKKAT